MDRSIDLAVQHKSRDVLIFDFFCSDFCNQDFLSQSLNFKTVAKAWQNTATNACNQTKLKIHNSRCFSVTWTHIKATIETAYTWTYGQSVDHRISYIFWKLWPRAIWWSVCWRWLMLRLRLTKIWLGEEFTGTKVFDPKLTQLTHLLRFASLFLQHWKDWKRKKFLIHRLGAGWCELWSDAIG